MWCATALITIHPVACIPWESNLESSLKPKNLYNITTCLCVRVCPCFSLCLPAKIAINFLLFCIVLLHVGWRCKFNMLYIFFVSFLIVGSMSSLCCLKMQSMKVSLPHPLKVKPNLSRATLSCSVKSKNQAHISWSHVVLVLTPVCVFTRS